MQDLIYYIKKVGIPDTILNLGFYSIILFRLGHWLYKLPLRKWNPLWYLFIIIKNLFIWFSKIELPPSCEIGKHLFLPHPYGIVMGNKVKIGNNCTLGPWSVIGHNGILSEQPQLGDNVYVGPHACILGKIKIGDNSLIGANAVVTKDVPENSIVKAPFEIKPKKQNV